MPHPHDRLTTRASPSPPVSHSSSFPPLPILPSPCPEISKAKNRHHPRRANHHARRPKIPRRNDLRSRSRALCRRHHSEYQIRLRPPARFLRRTTRSSPSPPCTGSKPLSVRASALAWNTIKPTKRSCVLTSSTASPLLLPSRLPERCSSGRDSIYAIGPTNLSWISPCAIARAYPPRYGAHERPRLRTPAPQSSRRRR